MSTPSRTSCMVREWHKVDSWAYWGPIWPYTVCGTAANKCFLAQAGFCCAADSLLSEVGSLSLDLSSSCSGIAQKWWNKWGHFKSKCFPCVFPGACSDTSILCESFSPLAVTTQTSWWLGSLHCTETVLCVAGTLLSCGSCFSKTLTPRMQLRSARVVRRGMIFFIVPGPSMQSFGISQCTEHPDTNPLTPTAHFNTHILKIAQQTTGTYGPEL